MKSIRSLQDEYLVIAKNNGWGNESARDTMLLLIEEVGELARAIRKREGLKRTSSYDIEVEDELADVMIYLVHLSNILKVDLGESVTNKISKNQSKIVE